MNDDRILVLENIKKSYFVEGHRIDVLKGVDLTLRKGEQLSLTGKSGAGKSTLLNIMATLERPDSGNILFNGTDPVKMSDAKLSSFRNREIGIVFQFHHLLPEFTALENVAIPLMLSISKKESLKKAEAMLERVGLSERLNHKPAELSGGEQQRVAIARALINDPSLLLMDEPTGNLDNETGKMIIELILSIAKERELTTLFVTHNKLFASEMGRMIEIKEGVVYNL
ncbi:MAG TPA: ABC transporter ATP-binding protein [bacterium]|jgi:lipoprotein-releasing system ATP-binding protein|nr:ABC transporter ATP-binding protein [bacterium]MDX9804641.1 ABC transporter ATP-binding protein [bacterium]HNW16688.1 ABC transporter ATP-binding protein [bacterium]HNZ53091.1 ABC transporter ATP-binding protein [bacterium]HOB71959.1 ABC transporter ATP-binding protein [bacterium]